MSTKKEEPKPIDHNEDTLDKIYQTFLKIKNRSLPVDEEIEKLGKMDIDIPEDYVDQGGLRKAHSVLKKIQSSKNEIINKILVCNSLVKKSEYLLNLAVDYIYETHPEIVSMKTQEMRETRAISSHKNIETIYKFRYFHNLLYKDLELVLENLKSANDNIKRQIDVVGYQIAIGEIRSRKPLTRGGNVGVEDL